MALGAEGDDIDDRTIVRYVAAMANNPNGRPAEGEKTIACTNVEHGHTCGAHNNADATFCFACRAPLTAPARSAKKKRAAAKPAAKKSTAKKKTSKGRA
ncbi:MAG: hypothetical protein JWL95_3240 [Gemmatimonadetes bacterium]|nr:hypothetical protein [Gemmatimonadota bacterium]